MAIPVVEQILDCLYEAGWTEDWTFQLNGVDRTFVGGDTFTGALKLIEKSGVIHTIDIDNRMTKTVHGVTVAVLPSDFTTATAVDGVWTGTITRHNGSTVETMAYFKLAGRWGPEA